jgi:hypothetical protein
LPPVKGAQAFWVIFHKSLLGLGYQGGRDWTQGETSVLHAGFLKHLPFPSKDTSKEEGNYSSHLIMG